MKERMESHCPCRSSEQGHVGEEKKQREQVLHTPLQQKGHEKGLSSEEKTAHPAVCQADPWKADCAQQ